MNSLFELSPICLIALNTLITILLYSATYAVFLAALRHPRNWDAIPVREKTLVLLSLILIIVFCSVSATGIDFPVMVSSTVFLFFLFLIIGAPSFALYHGAPKRWEFIARHSDRLILGLLTGAVFTSCCVSSIKLNILFSVAMLNELVWLLRTYRANQFQIQQPMNKKSLAVFHAHAGDNLKVFIRKNRIKELLTDDNETYWLGCNRHSLPCPINYYVNTLGLNTPQCCLEHLKELCHDIDQLLTNMEVPHWIDGGTLLGAVREKGTFLDWEDDVDISYMLDDSIEWDAFVTELTLKLNQHGYTVKISSKYIGIFYIPPARWLYGLEQYRHRGEIRVDLIGNRVVRSYGRKVMERPICKGAMPETESGRYGVPVDMIIPTGKIEFLGKIVSCPQDSDGYLRTVYGDYTRVDYTYVDNKAADSRRFLDEADQKKDAKPEF